MIVSEKWRNSQFPSFLLSDKQRPQNGREAELWRTRIGRNWIHSEPRNVIVPFADKVAIRTKTDAIRVRRDFTVVMELTMASGVLNKAQRSTDAKGRLVATTEDYAAAVSAAFGKSPVERAAKQALPSREEVDAALAGADGVREPTP